MSNTADPLAHASPEEIMAAHFAGMVIQQTNMAMMLLGQVPHPETGQTIQDLDGARMFIDQLEMLEFKTKGNLDKREENLLRQSLATLHLAFVEAVDAKPAVVTATAPAPPAPPPETPTLTSAPVADPAVADEESRKKFSKKY